MSNVYDKEKKDVTCPCGDEAHNNLEDWYTNYLRSSGGEKAPYKDKFDQDVLEARIQSLLPQVPVTNDYCPSCSRLLENWPEVIRQVPEHHPEEFSKPYQQPHFKDPLEFESGYRNGCKLCNLFVQCTIKRGKSLELWHRVQNRLECLGKSTVILASVRSDEGYYTLTLTWPGLKIYTWLPADPVYCVKNCDERKAFPFSYRITLIVIELFTLGENPTPLTDTAPSQLELAKKWLDACSSTHESCKPKENHQLPTRLIDISSTPICLVLSSTLSTTPRPRYATLSHCWGNGDFLKLTQDNLPQFLISIPKDKLTKTFLDAIDITRSLGLRYLWIDSLCIIQLSIPDWRRESALMASVYGGSEVTIAASGAQDGSEGCFLQPPDFVGKVRIFTPTSSTTTPNENEKEKDHWDIAPGSFYTSVVKSHLAGRAWALQERLLSPRTLFFTTTELFFECRHTSCSESFLEGLPVFQHQHIFHRDPKIALSDIWSTILRLYTSGKLSFANDKLVAISGIAEQISREREGKDSYLAGLWRSDIEVEMLWCQQHPGRRLPASAPYRAPTWSWASVDERGFCYYAPRIPESTYIHHAHVIAAHVTPLSPDQPFAEVVSGSLTLACSTMLVGKLRKIQGERFEGMDFSVTEIDVLPSSATDPSQIESFRVSPDTDEYANGKELFMVPILEVLGTGKFNKREVKGLLLEMGEKKGEFVRAGFWSCTAFDERHQKIQERFLALLEVDGVATAERVCGEVLKEVGGEERFVVTIV